MFFGRMDGRKYFGIQNFWRNEMFAKICLQSTNTKLGISWLEKRAPSKCKRDYDKRLVELTEMILCNCV